MATGAQKCSKCGAVSAPGESGGAVCSYCGTPFAALAPIDAPVGSVRARREAAMAESIALGKQVEQKLADLDSISYSEHSVQKGLRRFWGPVALLAAGGAALAYASQTLVCAVPLGIVAAASLLVWLAANPRSDKNATRRTLLQEELAYLQTRKENIRTELDDLQNLSEQVAAGQPRIPNDADESAKLKGNI